MTIDVRRRSRRAGIVAVVLMLSGPVACDDVMEPVATVDAPGDTTGQPADGSDGDEHGGDVDLDAESWWQGPCEPTVWPDAPPHRLLDFEDRNLRVGPDGACVCIPGFCMEIPADGTRVAFEISIGTNRQAPDAPWVIDSPLFLISVAGDSIEDVGAAIVGRYILVPWRSPQVEVPAASSDLFHTDRVSLRRPEFWFSAEARRLDGAWLGELELSAELPRVQIFATHEGNVCGDGEISPNEECDSADQPRGGCSLCEIRPGVSCSGEPSFCPAACEFVTCDNPGPCAAAECDGRTGRCTSRPANEGGECVARDGNSGWCRDGACIAEPRDCVPCGVGGRWWQGECRREEAGASWLPLPTAGGRIPVVDDGSRWLGIGPGGYGSSGRARVAEFDRAVDITDGWFEFEYREFPWFDGFGDPPIPLSDERTWLSVPGGSPRAWEHTLSPASSEWTTLRIPASVSTPTEWSVLAEMETWDEYYRGGGFELRGARFSQTGSGICRVALEIEDVWQPVCTPQFGVAECDGRCIDLLHDYRNCGDCGVVCGEDEVCESGECREDPVLRQHATTWPHGCPPGYGGLECDNPCPGVADGNPCSGNGRCDDGYYGGGTCDCVGSWREPTSGEVRHHGLNCQYSCADGIRNGDERWIDGGEVCVIYRPLAD